MGEDIVNAFVDAKTFVFTTYDNTKASTLSFYERVMTSPTTNMILTSLKSFYQKVLDIYRVIIAGYPTWKKQAIEFANEVPEHYENLKQKFNRFASEMSALYEIVSGKVVLAKDNLEIAKDNAYKVGGVMGECLEKSQEVIMGAYTSVCGEKCADKYDFGGEPASDVVSEPAASDL